jgi:hypothetical protein
MTMRSEAGFAADNLLPCCQERGHLPVSIGQSGPGSAHGIGSKAAIGKGRDDRSARAKEPPAQEHAQQVEKGQVGSYGHFVDQTA